MKKHLQKAALLALLFGVFFLHTSHEVEAADLPFTATIYYDSSAARFNNVQPNNLTFAGGSGSLALYSGFFPGSSTSTPVQGINSGDINCSGTWVACFITNQGFSTTTLTTGNYFVYLDPNLGTNKTDARYINLYFNANTGIVTPIFTPPNLNTRFISPYSPPDLTTSTSTTILFSVPYFFNDTTSFGVYDSVSLRITDLTEGGTVIDTQPTTINASGQNVYSTAAVLVWSHQYLWQPSMFLAASPSQRLVGDISTLWAVAISTTTETLNTAALAGTVGTSTLPSPTNFLSFLNVPVLLQTKIPFAYFFQIRDGLLQSTNSSSTTPIPKGQISYNLGMGTTTIDMFSTSTVAYFLSPSLVSLWRGLLVAFLYVEFGYVLYLRAKSKHLL